MENEMKSRFTFGLVALMAAAFAVGTVTPVRSDDAKPSTNPATFWTVPKEAGKVMLVVAGQKDPVTTSVTDTTVFAGICLDCNLPLEFKTGETAKNCSVCGCAVTNAACIVGKAVKTNTWQAMLKMLPHGTVLKPVYNEADKPESGLKKLTISLRSVLLPVSGLDAQTPDQLLAVTKPLGATKAELLDGGKLLSISLKTDWTADKADKLEKALVKLNAKVVVPEDDTKPAQ
jgi:hypothetical protein